MKIEGLLTDEVILEELGGRLARRRLELQLTQEMLAEQAGVSKRTVERAEAGATVQVSTLIRILRVWNCWIAWKHWCPKPAQGRWIWSG